MIQSMRKISISHYSFFFGILASFFCPIAPSIAIPWPLLLEVKINPDIPVDALYIFYISGYVLSTIGIILAVRGAKINKYRAFAITGFVMNVYLLVNCVSFTVIILFPFKF